MRTDRACHRTGTVRLRGRPGPGPAAPPADHGPHLDGLDARRQTERLRGEPDTSTARWAAFCPRVIGPTAGTRKDWAEPKLSVGRVRIAPVTEDVLQRFSPATRAWFTGAFHAPTPAQVGAWRAVSAGRHALVVAPTGSGKTLAAFLWALDRLASAPPPPDEAHRCRVLYVSPLKALAVDVERNLRSPLAGIRQAAGRLD